MFKFKVNKRSLETVEQSILVSGTINDYIVEFLFDECWEGWTPHAVFTNTWSHTTKEQLLEDNTCIIPWETLTPGTLLVGIYGMKDDKVRPTVYSEKFFIEEGVGHGDLSKEPTPEVYQQLLSNISHSVIDGADIDESYNLIIKTKSGDTYNAGILPRGKDGDDGLTPYIAENGNWWVGDKDTGHKAEGKDFTYEDLTLEQKLDIASHVPPATPIWSNIIDRPPIYIGSKEYSIQMYNSTASSEYSVSFGDHTEATAKASYAEGYHTHAQGMYSHAEGDNTYATKQSSHAEGSSTHAEGQMSHAEGKNTYASGSYSHSEGYATKAVASSTHAEGRYTEARATGAHVEGYGTKVAAGANDQHVQGRFNALCNKDYAHVVGNGEPILDEYGNLTFDEVGNVLANRSNAHTLTWDGVAWFSGYVTVGPSRERLATESVVDSKIAKMVDSAPATLDTLNELAHALGNDPNFATTIASQIGEKVDKEEGKGLSTYDFNDEYIDLITELENNIDTASQKVSNKVDKIPSYGLMRMEPNITANHEEYIWDAFIIGSRPIEEDGSVGSGSEIMVYSTVGTNKLLSQKVDKEDGKGLSTNDFTDRYVNMLAYGVIEGGRLVMSTEYITDPYNQVPTVEVTEMLINPPPIKAVPTTLTPNKQYNFGTVESLSLAFPIRAMDGAVIYLTFKSGATPTALTIDTTNTCDIECIPEANTGYEIFGKFVRTDDEDGFWIVNYSEYTVSEV